MDQIFIKVKNKKGHMIDKDIRDTTGEERLEWYNSSVKAELSIVIETLVKSTLR